MGWDGMIRVSSPRVSKGLGFGSAKPLLTRGLLTLPTPFPHPKLHHSFSSGSHFNRSLPK
jgi:hypothetical protein